MKSINVNGSKSSRWPISLEKRFKILPTETGLEKKNKANVIPEKIKIS